MMKLFLAIILFLVTIFAIAWLVEGNALFMQSTFAPKQEQVRRETFEQSKAYRDGMIQELQNMQFQYEQADSGHRLALRSIILHRAAACPDLPADLQVFISSLK
jgi:hypothetical protein